MKPAMPSFQHHNRDLARSLVYGDRHPDQGLWHVDCSSMKNFVRGAPYKKFSQGYQHDVLFRRAKLGPTV